MDTELHPIERARRTAALDGRLIDLMSTDFHAAGLRFGEDRYTAAYAAWRDQPAYQPFGRGGVYARESIAAAYREEGAPCAAQDVILTAGTSISYHILVRALAQLSLEAAPAALRSIATPRPGYPLFEDILASHGVVEHHYDCHPDAGFLPRAEDIRRLAEGSESTLSAIVLITPNNPAGVTYPQSLIEEIAGICAEHGITLIVDAVFSLFQVEAERHFFAHSLDRLPVPVVELNGLSKLCAAPEVKLSWIRLAGGSPAERERWSERLDTIHDVYLSVSGYAEAATQSFVAAPEARLERARLQSQVHARQRHTRAALQELPGFSTSGGVAGIHIPVAIDPVHAARCFGTLDDEAIALSLVESCGVYLHPGSFYGLDYPAFSSTPWLIASGISPPGTVDRATRALAQRLR